MDPDVRWKQRFSNFERALGLLGEAFAGDPENLSDLEKEGAVQRFEYTLELAWKTLKDFLEDAGYVLDPVTPRSVVKQANAAGLLPDGRVWMEMLDLRNLLSHTYDSSVFERSVGIIGSVFLPALQSLHGRLKQEW